MALKPASPAAQQAPQEYVEDVILRLPGLQATAESPAFQKFMDVIAPLVDLPKTSRFVLESFSSRDVTAEKLALALKSNVYFQQIFYQVIDSISKRKEGEPPPSLEAAIVLLGMQNSRNLILGLQMQRSVMGMHAEWTKEGKLKTQPKDLLKFALTVEDANAGKKDEYLDLAFSAGMLFDFFALIASAHENKKKLTPYVEEVYKQGYKTALIAAEICKTIPLFGYKRYFFAASMVHDIGKIAMAIVEPEYLDFLEECSKKDLPRPLRRYAEQKRFGVNHSVLGAVICYYYKVFAHFDRAILYQHEPFLLAVRDKKLFELSALVSLATNVASNFKKVDKLDDPVLKRWKGPELGAFKVDMAKVMQAVAKVP